eukprot:6175944-Pleurochrysis_carterae.AAC.1
MTLEHARTMTLEHARTMWACVAHVRHRSFTDMPEPRTTPPPSTSPTLPGNASLAPTLPAPARMAVFHFNSSRCHHPISDQPPDNLRPICLFPSGLPSFCLSLERSASFACSNAQPKQHVSSVCLVPSCRPAP